MDIKQYFLKPESLRQKQYEAIRAIFVDNLSVSEVAKKFGYSVNTIYSIIRDVKAEKLQLFPKIIKGPKKRRVGIEIQNKIVAYRKEKLSSPDIVEKLKNENIKISTRTVERILKDYGFDKLKRRTNRELGRTKKKKIIPNRTENLNIEKIKPFNIDCPVVGVYFFIPYIIESGIVEIFKKCSLPETKNIGAIQTCLTFLLLKLIGNKRISQMENYDSEPGLGVFAGLNILPKASYMSTYSCRASEKMLLTLQEEIVKQFRKKYKNLYKSNYINLDFHTIPHYGEKSEMEKIWSGSRNKALKGANTIFVQDGQSNVILYTRADILRKEETKEIKKFILYWKKIKGSVDETLVFDCKLTKYEVLDEITDEKIKFITIRKRSKSLLKEYLNISKKNWIKVDLSIPKRKYTKVSVNEQIIKLESCRNSFRQIIIKDNGRIEPTFIITNNMELSIKEIFIVYAKRWHIENKLSELVGFFNLNALSSPLMIRIHFDILFTVIADTLYHIFAEDLRRFKNCLAPTLFRKFINMPGRIIYDGETFFIKIRKRSHTPILKGIDKLTKTFNIPWLNNKKMCIEWTS